MAKRLLLSIYLSIFILGWFSAVFYTDYAANIEQPTQHSYVNPEDKELDSPYDFIKESQIKVYKDNIILDIQNAQWARFINTNSMDPVLDETANAIELVPNSPEDIHVGDIVSYKSIYTDGSVIHRVVQIDEDEKGWYAILKGDNNTDIDPEKVRFDQIQRVVVAIIY